VKRLTDEELDVIAEDNRLKKTDGYITAEETRSIVSELRALRELLATPWVEKNGSSSREPYVYDNADPRIAMNLHRGVHIITADHARALGAALIRAARTALQAKEGE
jgi:hypothetical protein